MFRHILPNAMAPILVPITFGIAAAILIESGLSFLGFGDADNPSWGTLLSDGRSNYKLWWLILFPGAGRVLRRAGVQPDRRRTAGGDRSAAARGGEVMERAGREDASGTLDVRLLTDGLVCRPGTAHVTAPGHRREPADLLLHR